MNNTNVFLNTKIEGSGALSWIGDLGLAPVRYLFNGKTVRIVKEEGKETTISHVNSFSKGGQGSTGTELHPSHTSGLRTIAAVAFLIPGLVLSAFKLLAYVFSDVKERHRLAKEHFTPIEVQEIGSKEAPIENEKDLINKLGEFIDKNSKNQPVNALVIHGKGNLEISQCVRINILNPMKLVLDGARLVRDKKVSNIPLLDDLMNTSGKWLAKSSRGPDSTFTTVQSVSSVEEALKVQAPRRGWISCRRFHMVFEIAPQKA